MRPLVIGIPDIGHDINLFKTKSVGVSFISKLTLYRQNICRREFYQFPSLQAAPDITDVLLRVYASHIESMKEDMQIRFNDLIQLIIPDWVLSPFTTDLQIVELEIQEQLAELQTDIESQMEFNQLVYTNFWLQTKNILRMPLLCQRTKLLILAFPTSYFVEKGFNSVMRLHSKQRNRLQITKSGDLRLMLTKFEPNVVKLVGEQLCHENDEHFERLLLRTEVRWLSKGNCLKRFTELFDTIVEFLDRFNRELSHQIKIRKNDIAYLDKLNSLNLQLQGCRKRRSFSERALMVLITVMTTCSDEFSCSLSFLATKCWRCITQCIENMLGITFFNRAINPR